MLSTLGRVRPDLVLDVVGLVLLVVMVAVLWGSWALGVAGTACLLLSWRYTSS